VKRKQGLSLQAISDRVKYRHSKGQMRNVSKGKVHRVIKANKVSMELVKKVVKSASKKRLQNLSSYGMILSVIKVGVFDCKPSEPEEF
jgi:hypothetical protein